MPPISQLTPGRPVSQPPVSKEALLKFRSEFEGALQIYDVSFDAPTEERMATDPMAMIAAATNVVVNSEWSRDALIAQGVAREKLIVLPLAYEVPEMPSPPRTRPANEFRVLWLGQVILRKGIQYLLEAARLLRSSIVQVEFFIAVANKCPRKIACFYKPSLELC